MKSPERHPAIRRILLNEKYGKTCLQGLYWSLFRAELKDRSCFSYLFLMTDLEGIIVIISW